MHAIAPSAQGRPSGEPEHPPETLDGVEIPGALFTHDPALQTAFTRISPTEVSYFTTLPAAEVIRVCREIAGGGEPKRKVLRDEYYDTAAGELSKRGVSVRLRRYTVHTRPLAFEVLAIAWGNVKPRGPLGARTNQVLVQTFARNGPEHYRALAEQYARAGYGVVAEVGKTRVGWDLQPVVFELSSGDVAIGMDHRGIDGERGELRVTDLGLKLLVDELHDPVFPERTIIEVEYGPAHEAQAVEVVARLRAAFGAALRDKARNKIAYLLAG
jgi:hypothetical protein